MPDAVAPSQVAWFAIGIGDRGTFLDSFSPDGWPYPGFAGVARAESVAAQAPEPSSLAMMLGGLGVALLALKCCRRENILSRTGNNA